jgi:hypothetical protein
MWQVEFYFSDINLATTEHLMKFIANDPDGFGEFICVISNKLPNQPVSWYITVLLDSLLLSRPFENAL